MEKESFGVGISFCFIFIANTVGKHYACKYKWCHSLILIELNKVKEINFVNTRGGLGRNIPCDLYNEHVNKLFRVIIQTWEQTFQKNLCRE